MIRSIIVTCGSAALVGLGLPPGAALATAGPPPTASPCFGAATREVRRPCHDPALQRVVFPTPAAARHQSSPRCTNVVKTPTWWVCALGAPAAQARASVALIGDSHAGHWRPAVGAFARAAGVRALSITRSSCPFSAGTPDLPPVRRARCVRWRRHVLQWLGSHPEVTTVFVSAHTGARLALPRGTPQQPAKAAAYARAWRSLPASVEHVVVLRDVPRTPHATMTCVTRAIARHAAAGSACAVPRRFAVRKDAAVVAARHVRGGRVRVLDLTRFFCGPRRCLPVIGGALVHKDTGHMTADYAQSLGPSLTREVAALRPKLTFGAPAVARLAFAGAAEAGAARIRYALAARLPRAWRLTFRSSEGAVAQVTAADRRVCGYRIALIVQGTVRAAGATSADHLLRLAPLGTQPAMSGQTARRRGAPTAWGTWTTTPAGIVGGAAVVPFDRAGAAGGAALQIAVTAAPSVPCPGTDADREAGAIGELLRTLRVAAAH